ncbi:MAG: protein O-mannosyl-transferase family [Candidatus Krumholzibacteriia bacterium]
MPRRDVGACVAALAAVFLVFYLLTSHYDVTMDAGDAAQFQTIGVVGGIPHQPYPLWCVLSNCAALLPIGEPAFRITLLSALCASVSIGLLFLLFVQMTGDALASMIACAAFGLSHAFWQIAVVAEIYALSTLLFIIFLLCLTRWVAADSVPAWLALAFTTGLVVSHHQLNVAVLPALALVLWRYRWRVRQRYSARHALAAAALFLLPFTLYVYTYVIDGNPNTLNWYDNQGQYLYADRGLDPAAFAGFWERLRFQMWPARYGEIVQTPAAFAARAVLWVRHLVSLEFPFLAPFIMMAGFVSLWRDSRLRWFWLLLMATYGALAVNYLSGGSLTYTYSIPIYVVLCLYLSQGVALARRGAARGRRVLLPVVLGGALVALPVLRHLAASPFARFLRSAEGVAEVEAGSGLFWHLIASGNKGRLYGESVAGAVAPNSLIFAAWAEGNVLFYHKLAKGLLRDVGIHYVLPRPEYMARLIREKAPVAVYFTVRPDSLGFESAEVLAVEPGRRLYRVDVAGIAGPTHGR